MKIPPKFIAYPTLCAMTKSVRRTVPMSCVAFVTKPRASAGFTKPDEAWVQKSQIARPGRWPRHKGRHVPAYPVRAFEA